MEPYSADNIKRNKRKNHEAEEEVIVPNLIIHAPLVKGLPEKIERKKKKEILSIEQFFEMSSIEIGLILYEA